MTLAGLVLLCLILGAILYFFPMDGVIKNILLCILVIIAIITIAHALGWTGGINWRM